MSAESKRAGLRANRSMSPRPHSEALQTSDEYLTIEELSARLKIKPKSIKNKMASGIFQKGIHYFSPRGLSPRFKWSAIVAWLEETDKAAADQPTMPFLWRAAISWDSADRKKVQPPLDNT